MKAKEVRLLNTQEIRNRLADSRRELMNLRFQIVSGQLTDTTRLGQMRRQIALFETVLKARELGLEEEGEKK